jgi:hypothetical protein
LGHVPYGYVIKNGVAAVDEEKAANIKNLYKYYLAGMALDKAAREAGMNIPRSSAKLLMKNKRYIGDEFYPAIISKDIFDQAEEERLRRAASLGRLHLPKKIQPKAAATSFHWHEVLHHYENPKQQAEYLYSLIESEGVQWEKS